MIDLIANNREAIADLCRQYGVQRLAVFGSAVNGTFDPDTSDVDFLVEMADYGPGVVMRYLSLGVALEDLLGLNIDLTTERSLHHPRFREEVLSTMKVLIDDGVTERGSRAVA